MKTISHIGFIGGGNMARCLIGGLLADGHPADAISVSEPDATQRDYLHNTFGVSCYATAEQLVAHADAIVLAVKPQIMSTVAHALRESLSTHKPLIISIAAGITIKSLQRWLGADLAIVRSMPNTPALVQAGATGLYAAPQVNATQRSLAESVLRAVGITVWVEQENTLDTVTALSGSGPAYVFLLMESLQQAAEQLGLNTEQARLLTLQTVFGAAKMAVESPESTATLRERVTSKGGTTAAALAVFENGGFRNLVNKAVSAAQQRAQTLAQELDQD
ncbi:MAG: pyrroline-5-carboxylate reductase [Gammaproteobacteria bacterium]|nr:pyrroline-5-carboxylate reductase [Gammaproteobacteria bacterium]